MRRYLSVVCLIALTAMSLASCAPQTATPSQTVKIRLALLPIIDALPVYVADQEGIFARYNIDVEVVPVASAPERDQLISAGQADGMINETLSTFFFNREAPLVKIVRYALTPSPNAGHFFILASAQSGITTPEELKGVEIGVSQGTVIEYVTFRMLEKAGLKTEEIKTIAVPKMPDRMALLASGDLKAAVDADPLAALSIKQGAKVVMSDAEYPHYGFSVYSFRTSFLEKNPDAVKAFLQAIEEAITLINTNPQNFNDILSEQKLVPEPLLANYSAPPYPPAAIPSGIEWKDALQWAQSRSLINEDVSFEESVTDAYLPK